MIMITIIRNAKVYQPEYAGIKDVMLIGSQIGALGENLKANLGGAVEVKEIDGTGLILIPGIIDSHEHILGGGGEGGFHTRTPEATLTGLTLNGVTTVVGCIGTDGVARNMEALLAKAHALEEEGVTTYVYTGSYRVPVHTITGDVMRDIMLLDKVIGVGEVAISDHRSSQPTFEEFARIAADIRVGGMLSGKAGIVNVHMGDGPRMMDFIWRTVRETEIPFSQFLPTHVGRNAALFESALEFAKAGGTIDFTGSLDDDDEVPVSKGILRLLDAGVSSDHFTISSDGQGSLPIFNEKGEFQGLGVGNASCLLKELRECVNKAGLPLELALKPLTANPARILKLARKGRILPGCDGDICLLREEDLSLHTAIAKGQIMVAEGAAVVRGTFEK